MFSKYKGVRCNTPEFLSQILHTWPLHILDDHLETLQKALKTGLVDTDPDTRLKARNAYWAFADRFSVEADCLLSFLGQDSDREMARSEGRRQSLNLRRKSIHLEKGKQTRF